MEFDIIMQKDQPTKNEESIINFEGFYGNTFINRPDTKKSDAVKISSHPNLYMVTLEASEYASSETCCRYDIDVLKKRMLMSLIIRDFGSEILRHRELLDIHWKDGGHLGGLYLYVHLHIVITEEQYQKLLD